MSSQTEDSVGLMFKKLESDENANVTLRLQSLHETRVR